MFQFLFETFTFTHTIACVWAFFFEGPTDKLFDERYTLGISESSILPTLSWKLFLTDNFYYYTTERTKQDKKNPWAENERKPI